MLQLNASVVAGTGTAKCHTRARPVHRDCLFQQRIMKLCISRCLPVWSLPCAQFSYICLRRFDNLCCVSLIILPHPFHLCHVLLVELNHCFFLTVHAKSKAGCVANRSQFPLRWMWWKRRDRTIKFLLCCCRKHETFAHSYGDGQASLLLQHKCAYLQIGSVRPIFGDRNFFLFYAEVFLKVLFATVRTVCVVVEILKF